MELWYVEHVVSSGESDTIVTVNVVFCVFFVFLLTICGLQLKSIKALDRFLKEKMVCVCLWLVIVETKDREERLCHIGHSIDCHFSPILSNKLLHFLIYVVFFPTSLNRTLQFFISTVFGPKSVNQMLHFLYFCCMNMDFFNHLLHFSKFKYVYSMPNLVISFPDSTTWSIVYPSSIPPRPDLFFYLASGA